LCITTETTRTMMYSDYNYSNKLNRIKAIIISALMLIICIGTLTGCVRREAHVVNGFYFDTVISVEFYESADMTMPAQDLETACKDLCRYYENLLSATIKDSEVSMINENAGSTVTVSEETAELIRVAVEVAGMTDGAYDPSIAPLSGLWNISEVAKTADELTEEERRGLIPSDEDIREALNNVDYSRIIVDGNKVTLPDERMKIDLGGIAKGYIADKLIEMLRDAGIEHALINLGGNVAALGGNIEGEPYVIGLQKPFGNEGEVILSIKDTDRAIVTSGPYERYFEADGRKYHHILDTGTGEPVENDLYAVTIVGEKGVMSDALSTACYCLGYERSLELLKGLDGYEGIFIYDDYSYATTENFPEKYELREVK